MAEFLIVQRAFDVATMRRDADWDAFFDKNNNDDVSLRSFVLAKRDDESADDNSDDDSLILTDEVYVCSDARKPQTYANCVGIVWFRRDAENNVIMLHYVGVRREWRGKGVARLHLHRVIHDRIMQNLYGPELPLFACVPISMRSALQFLDRLLVPLGLAQQPLRGAECVMLGPPLGWSGRGPPTPPVACNDSFEPLHSNLDLERHVEQVRERAPHLLVDAKKRFNTTKAAHNVMLSFANLNLPLIAVGGTALAVARYGNLLLPWNDRVTFALHRATYIYLREHLPSELRSYWWIMYSFSFQDHIRYPDAEWLTVQTSHHDDSSNKIILHSMHYNAKSNSFAVHGWKESMGAHHVHCCTYSDIVRHLYICLDEDVMLPGNYTDSLERCFRGWRKKIVVKDLRTRQIAMRFPATNKHVDAFLCRPLEARFAHLALDETFFDFAGERKRGIAFCIAILTKNDLLYLLRTLASLRSALELQTQDQDALDCFAVGVVFDETQVSHNQVHVASRRANELGHAIINVDEDADIDDKLVARRKQLRVTLHPYAARVAQSGLETYVTPCNSAHSRAWFFQYCVQQTGDQLSHYCKWPCNALMTTELARKLAREYSDTAPRAISDVIALNVKDVHTEVCSQQCMIFSIESKVRYHRQFLWECWSTTLNRRPPSAVGQDDAIHVLLNTALDHETPLITGECCWFYDEKNCAGLFDAEERAAAKRAKHQYNRWTAQLDGEQLFCRPNDPNCAALMHTLTQTTAKIDFSV